MKSPDGGERQFPVVGIGASAGGVEALSALFGRLPPMPGAAFIVVTHLSPNRTSMLPEILGRYTAMPVVEAADGQVIEKDHVFLNSPQSTLTVADGHFKLSPRTADHNPIDVLLASLAMDFGERAVGVILSGSGTDGSIGTKAISECGGITLAQGNDSGKLKFSDMPDSAVATGFVDCVLPVAALADRLADYIASGRSVEEEKIANDINDDKKDLHELLQSSTGHDFSHYKEKTFLRRVGRRMQVHQIRDLRSYVEFIRRDPTETALLLRDLLIGVTSFFRDGESFDALAVLVVPHLFDRKSAGDMVRVWVPGCATGEEAYSLAMLLREGLDRHAKDVNLQIFATDLDEKALAVARTGRYPSAVLQSVSRERLERFFVREGSSYSITKEIRAVCRFSVHSLIRDPPFSQIDLISCRNLLIYFDSGLQNRVIPLFHYALRPQGYLFLGISENVSQHTDMFGPVDKKNRIFQRRETSNRRPEILPFFFQLDAQRSLPTQAVPVTNRQSLAKRAKDRILERFAPAHVLVNRDGEIIHYSSRTGRYLEQPTGAPSRNLLALARKGLDPALRAALREAVASGRRVERSQVSVEVNGGAVQTVDLAVEPLTDGQGDTCWLVVFTDANVVPRPATPSEERADSHGGDETVLTLQQELSDANQRLQTITEEHETSVEELKSANEELLSLNEELQSTNEEMETSKEELQSLNEELNTVNAELSGKIDELDRANSDLKNLFDSTKIATMFLDNDLIIRNFTPAVGEIIKLIPSDQGRPLSDIATQLDCDTLTGDIRQVVETAEAVEKKVSRRDGKTHYLMRIVPYRMANNEIKGVSVSFVNVTDLVLAENHHRFLVAELNHRVKNMMAVVAAFSQQMAKRYTTVDDFAKAFVGRIQGMAKTHEMLSRTGWTHVGLADLLAAELSVFVVDAEHYRLNGPDIRLRPAAATTLGVAFHELATNAMKYGALSQPEGMIRVEWRIERRTGSDWLALTWRETGGPPVVPPATRGLGTEIINRGVGYELGGQTGIEFAPEGIVATISFPTADALT